MGCKSHPILPRDQNDVAAAAAALECGLPALEPALPALLRWLRNPRWPVAGVITPFFATHGEAALPHVKRAFGSRDPVWKANLLRTVVAHWDEALVARLKPELELVLTTFDASGADLAACGLLLRHRISDPEWLRRWLEFKQARWQALLDESRALADSLSAAGPGPHHGGR